MKSNIIKKFTSGNWLIFYRNNSKWKILKGKKGYWYADPTLFEHEGKIYLFTEAFEIGCQIGRLAVSEYKEGTFTEPEVIIKKPYHMSYPCTFEEDGKVYMIPETSQNHTMEIYIAENENLTKWTKCKDLLSGIKCVDTTVFSFNESLYLFTYLQGKNEFITKVYILDIQNLSVREIYSKKSTDNNLRPAGRPFQSEDGEWMRPVQNNIRLYGESMRFITFNPTEKEWLGRVKYNVDAKMLGLDKYGSRTHTFGKIGNLEVVDVLHEYKSPVVPLFKIRRRLNNLYFKLKFRDF